MKLLEKPVGLLVNFHVSDFKDGFKVLRWSLHVSRVSHICVRVEKNTWRYDKIRGVKKVSTYRVYRKYLCKGWKKIREDIIRYAEKKSLLVSHVSRVSVSYWKKIRADMIRYAEKNIIFAIIWRGFLAYCYFSLSSLIWGRKVMIIFRFRIMISRNGIISTPETRSLTAGILSRLQQVHFIICWCNK